MPGTSKTSAIRLCPKPDGERVETGAVQFGDDWPGLFIRGDEAVDVSLQIKAVIDFLTDHVSDEDKVKKGGFALAIAVGRLRGVKEIIDNDVNLFKEKSDDGAGATG